MISITYILFELPYPQYYPFGCGQPFLLQFADIGIWNCFNCCKLKVFILIEFQASFRIFLNFYFNYECETTTSLEFSLQPFFVFGSCQPFLLQFADMELGVRFSLRWFFFLLFLLHFADIGIWKCQKIALNEYFWVQLKIAC